MGKTLFGVADPSTYGPSNANYGLITGGDNIDTTEAWFQFVIRTAGTFSKLTVSNNAGAGTGRSVRFRKNAGNGNQLVSTPDGTAGITTDSVNSDSVVSGDAIAVLYSVASGVYNIRSVFGVYQASSGHVCLYAQALRIANTQDSTNRFVPMVGGDFSDVWSATESQSQVRIAGSLGNFHGYISANARTSTTTLKTRVNGADGTCALTITAGSTGLFEDTSNTDSIVSGDLLSVCMTTGAGSGEAIMARIVGSTITASSGNSNDVMSGGPVSLSFNASTRYCAIIGIFDGVTTEAQAQIKHYFPVSASKLRWKLTANTFASDGTVISRVNGGNGNQTLTLGAGLTGWFEDTSNSDTLAENDLFCTALSGGTSGSISVQMTMITETDLTAGTPLLLGQTWI